MLGPRVLARRPNSNFLADLRTSRRLERAVATQRVDLADIPASAKLAAPPVPTVAAPPAPAPSQSGQASARPIGQKKRKLVLSESSPSLSQSGASSTSATPVGARHLANSALQDEDEEVTIVEPEPVDELYCEMNTSIVGVQYYKGLVGPGEEVRLIREPRNQYDR
ncbi:hypothetical protein BU15DRAFT_75697 [Melanogaster broomeanus]|nr:hypothetical protein BU15DRAFT_75697 [Melanogaster broomeanus]